MKHRKWLWFELTSIFYGVPLLIYFFGFVIAPVPILLLLTLYIIYLVHRKKIQKKRVLHWRFIKQKWFSFIVERFIVTSLLLFLMIVIIDYRQLFSFVLSDPLLWLVVIIAYPLFSVVPQEILYRSFFSSVISRFFRKK